MEQTALSALTHWSNFYVIVGSSAGALTGLQFVVMTLVAEANVPSSMREIRAFGTPTVVHFCVALLVSAIMNVPWESISYLGVSLAAIGAAGLVYALFVIRHARKQTGYAPDAEDWFWYTALPLIAYAGLAGEGILLSSNARWGLLLVAATTLLLMFIGIHNAWDTVTYVAVDRQKSK